MSHITSSPWFKFVSYFGLTFDTETPSFWRGSSPFGGPFPTFRHQRDDHDSFKSRDLDILILTSHGRPDATTTTGKSEGKDRIKTLKDHK